MLLFKSRTAFAPCALFNNVRLQTHLRFRSRVYNSSPPSRTWQAPRACERKCKLPTAAYIHLPFCAQRCAYCAFTVIVSGQSALPQPHTPPPLKSHITYIDLLCREIIAFFTLRNTVSHPPLKSLYLGGGTPSLLHPTLFERLLKTIRTFVPFDCNITEITCEMDPATFTQDAAVEFANLGINRASIGAQSFNDSVLKTCNRVHRRADIHAAVSAVRAAGIQNVSLDLISALPGQTISDWTDSLEQACKLSPEHISVYDLTLEAGTSFGNRYTAGMAPLPTEGVSVDMLTEAVQVLHEYSFERYEVSNFARGPGGTQSRHNLSYWRNEPFYGFGLGATSLVDDFRFARPRQLKQYEAYIKELETATGTADLHNLDRILYPHVNKLSALEQFEDYFINSMRLLKEGVSLSYVREAFGEVFEERLTRAIELCKQWVDNGSLDTAYNQHGVLCNFKLTEKGALVENAIVSDLLLEAVWRSPP